MSFHLILAETKQSTILSRGITAQQLLDAASQVRRKTSTQFNGVGHLIAQEAPKRLGEEIANTLSEWMDGRQGVSAKL